MCNCSKLSKPLYYLDFVLECCQLYYIYLCNSDTRGHNAGCIINDLFTQKHSAVEKAVSARPVEAQ